MRTYEQKKALRDKGLTYREIAAELGVSHQAVAQAEHFTPTTWQQVLHHTA